MSYVEEELACDIFWKISKQYVDKESACDIVITNISRQYSAEESAAQDFLKRTTSELLSAVPLNLIVDSFI